jgi:Protein of unknown function (DUF 659)
LEHNTKSSKCIHYRTLINYHKKIESVKVHLNKCAPFRKFMNGTEDADRPDWYIRNGKSRTSQQQRTVPSNSKSSGSSRQSSMKEFTLPAVSAYEKIQFQQHIAKHFYATGTPFQRVEDVHLVQAVQALRPDCDLLPRRKQLATTLLDKCHAELLAKVNARMLGAITCLTTDAWMNIKNDSIVNYMAVAPESCLFLESVSTGQQGHDHTFLSLTTSPASSASTRKRPSRVR